MADAEPAAGAGAGRSGASPGSTSSRPRTPGTRSSILVLCYLFNYIDRNILSILAEDVKRDLGLSDSTIGFLYGTAFAVFYAVFGIPFGRLADAWIRKNLIAIGLFFWSLMTALTGTAASFALLAIYRVGVGVGEASLSPERLLAPVRHVPEAAARDRALDLLRAASTSAPALGFVLGGLIVDTWNRLYPDTSLRAVRAGRLAGRVLRGRHPRPADGDLGVDAARAAQGRTGRGDGEAARAPRPQPFREFASVVPPLHADLAVAGGRRADGIVDQSSAAPALLGARRLGDGDGGRRPGAVVRARGRALRRLLVGAGHPRARAAHLRSASSATARS